MTSSYTVPPSMALRSRGLSNATLWEEDTAPTPGKGLDTPQTRARGSSSATLFDHNVLTKEQIIVQELGKSLSRPQPRARGSSSATLFDSSVLTKEQIIAQGNNAPALKIDVIKGTNPFDDSFATGRKRGSSVTTLCEGGAPSPTAKSFASRSRRPSVLSSTKWDSSTSTLASPTSTLASLTSTLASPASHKDSPLLSDGGRTSVPTLMPPPFRQRRLSSAATLVDGHSSHETSEGTFGAGRRRRQSSLAVRPEFDAMPMPELAELEDADPELPENLLLLKEPVAGPQTPFQTVFRFLPAEPARQSLEIDPVAKIDGPDSADPLQVILPKIPKRTHSLLSSASRSSDALSVQLAPEALDLDASTRLDASGPVSVPLLQEKAASAVKPTLRQKVDAQASQARPATVKYGYYSLMTFLVYFALVGFPLWNGVLYTVWTQIHVAELPFGFLLFSGINCIFVFTPLLFGSYEKPAPSLAPGEVRSKTENTALLIPCYKAAGALPNTIRAALKIFPATSIFVVDNGNTEKGTDASEQVCAEWGVNYLFVPVGSKIGAEYVGISQAKMNRFKYVMVIDDDVELPENLPLVTERFENDPRVGCVGYTLQSIGPNGTKGTIVQQLQDLEYRLSGLRHCMGAKYGSATFPHGAIILWNREVFVDLFQKHPGFKISEDLCFGMICRLSGRYVDFCSQVAVPTETPPYLFGPRADHPFEALRETVQYRWQQWRLSRAATKPLIDLESQQAVSERANSSGNPFASPDDASAAEDPFASPEDEEATGRPSTSADAASAGPLVATADLIGVEDVSCEKECKDDLKAAPTAAIPQTRGGYGEMTVYKQRYERWAFMHCWALIPQIMYMFNGWTLGWRTPVAQLLQFQDTLSTLFYLFLPFMLPCAFYYNAPLACYTIVANTFFGLASGLIFNAWHLRGRPEGRLRWIVPFASVPYRMIMRFVQLAAIYRGLFKYGLFFGTKTHKLPAHPKLGPLARAQAALKEESL